MRKRCAGNGGKGRRVGRPGTSLPTTGTAKGKCLNHLKLQRQGFVTMANGNALCAEVHDTL